jgi:hypothetical protein
MQNTFACMQYGAGGLTQRGPQSVSARYGKSCLEHILGMHVCQCSKMTKTKKLLSSSARATLAAVEKEMRLPRMTESVRSDKRYQATLTARRPIAPNRQPDRVCAKLLHS